MTAEEKHETIAESIGIELDPYDGRNYKVDLEDGKIYGLIHEDDSDGYSFYTWDIKRLKADREWLEDLLKTCAGEDCYGDHIGDLLKWVHSDWWEEVPFPTEISGDCVFFHTAPDVSVELADD